MISVISHSREETYALGRKIGASLTQSSVIALFGGMGMGKTVFTSGLAEGLGVDSPVSSPTFAIVHEHSGRLPLYHFDMYRVETYYDLESAGFFEYLERGGIVCTEWSENIENALPEGCIRVTISRGETDGERIITVDGDESLENTIA